jgi:hypothetical protein
MLLLPSEEAVVTVTGGGGEGTFQFVRHSALHMLLHIMRYAYETTSITSQEFLKRNVEREAEKEDV